MDLISKFIAGQIGGYGLPEKIIDTQISNVFLFKERAVKVYKKADAFIGDIGDPVHRKKFYQEDFSWNQRMSPDIYLRLVELEGDFYIEMSRVDTGKSLTNLLINKNITDEEMQKIGREMTEKIDQLTAEKKANIKVFERSWHDLMMDRLEDLRHFSYIVENHIPRATTDKLIDNFKRFLKSSEYMRQVKDSDVVVYIDNHSDNILVNENKVLFIDIYPAKENWLAADRFHNICRTVADVLVLAGQEAAAKMMTGYSKLYEPGPADVQDFYIKYNAMIKAAYYYMIGKHDLAKKYFEFTFKKEKQ